MVCFVCLHVRIYGNLYSKTTCRKPSNNKSDYSPHTLNVFRSVKRRSSHSAAKRLLTDKLCYYNSVLLSRSPPPFSRSLCQSYSIVAVAAIAVVGSAEKLLVLSYRQQPVIPENSRRIPSFIIGFTKAEQPLFLLPLLPLFLFLSFYPVNGSH